MEFDEPTVGGWPFAAETLIDQSLFCFPHSKDSLVNSPPLLSDFDGLLPLPNGLDNAAIPLACLSPPHQFDDIDFMDSSAWFDVPDSLPDHKERGLVVGKRKETEKAVVGNRRSKSTEVGLDEIRAHFGMPITRAAAEMNIGLTVLKKRCRHLGITRWPHRKMKSLNTLIHNMQEIGKVSSDVDIEKELQSLEEHRRLMEKNPEIQLTERTKRLRQACFKSNYKKRRAMQLYEAGLRMVPFS
ncbi:hypothetical protein HPP92_003653 [Vanilla planifolia]|uniref:RWP-RK domain-containing protein n=1 Tax=Vanilla planifolia TaxID=51239 RepID=A0A835S8S7_VANPL|nr:hypothetical protein HPP92_003653 [Vanilla planifolia]